jgi:Tol biopolymer transport system component/DNA-binding winged helix-turn-helix (wHTH) protein
MPTEDTNPKVRFAGYSFDLKSGELSGHGTKDRLPHQPARILALLIQHAGEVVSREEITRHVWGSETFVDFGKGLNFAVWQIRRHLAEDAEHPRFIETVPKRGYRFIALLEQPEADLEGQLEPGPEPPPVDATAGRLPTLSSPTAAAPAAAPSPQPPEPHAIRPQPSRRRRVWMLIVAFPACAAVAIMLVYLLRPPAMTIRVTRIAKLSSSSRAWFKESLFSDGVSVYYTMFDSGKRYHLRKVSLSGNQDRVVDGLPPGMIVRGLSPDQTKFLCVSGAAVATRSPSPVWTVPPTGGFPRRLGNILANDIAWSPDGRWLAYMRADQLFIASSDGSGERALARIKGGILPHWSPDGSKLRLTVSDATGQFRIWEIGADGSNLHRLQFNWPDPQQEGFGQWSADGHYYVFESHRDGISNLWAIAEKSDGLRGRQPEPVQLTAGPMSYYRPLPSRDGSQVFAVGVQFAGELVRYDMSRRQFDQFLGGMSISDVDFSRDGQWMTYVAFPEGTLWRARSDGSDPLQLTAPPLLAFSPRWSPDGKRICFAGKRAGQISKVYMIEADGGRSEQIFDEPYSQSGPSWLPAGEAIMYGRDPSAEDPEIALYRLDLRSGRREKIPKTDGLYDPLWSPNGQRLAAYSTGGQRRLVLVDINTGKSAPVADGTAHYAVWSADSQYLYFNAISADELALFRVHVPDGKKEQITRVSFRSTGARGPWSGLAPDGSPLLLRSRSQADVYALRLANP